jgi:RNase P/RNase MRP subunit p30
MDFVDLLVAKPELSGLERKLGFSQSFSLPISAINSQADISRKLSRPCAVESTSIDILMACFRQGNAALINPFLAKSFEREPKLFRKAADEGKAIEFPLSTFIDTTGNRRAGRLHVASKAVLLCRKHKAMMVVTSRATTEAGCKSPQEVVAIATAFLGMNDSEARKAIGQNPLSIAKELALTPI